MKAKREMTLAEMATRAASASGRLICPKCHCPDFKTYCTKHGVASTFRYKKCTNCGHRIYTVQNPETIVRSLEEPTSVDDDIESDGDLL
jgi:hypothetical protein